MNKWLVARYKLTEIARLEANLQNQNFEYYLPKIVLEKLNSILKEEFMFPGYIFINSSPKNYSVLKYTKGIKKILKFGNSIPTISKDDIEAIMKVESESKNNPISSKHIIGREVLIKGGSLKGNLVKICSLTAAKRVNVFIHLLGSKRKVSIALTDLSL